MPALALLSAVLVVALEQYVQWKYGVLGATGLLLLTVGVKSRNPTVSSAGALLLALLVTGPAM